MSPSARARPSVGTRRFGYVVAVLVNLALLFLTNAWPGWEAVPFLTADTALVLPAVNTSLVVGIGANLLYVVRDPVWLKAAGDVVTLAVGLFALLRVWDVFPLDLPDSGFDWMLLARVLLGFGIVGSCIGVVTSVVSGVRAAGRPTVTSRRS